MKKLFKVIAGIGAVVGGVCGALYIMDKYKKDNDDFDEFDDDEFDDVFADEEDGDRDYVTIDLEGEEEAKADSGSDSKEE